MWTWFKGDYVIPKGLSYPFLGPDDVLPVMEHANCIQIPVAISGKFCRSRGYKALTRKGLDALCTYCKHGIKRVVDPDVACSFEPDTKQMKTTGCHEVLERIVETMELPIWAVLKDWSKVNPTYSDLDFDPDRIRWNMQALARKSSEMWKEHVETSAHIHYFTSGTLNGRNLEVDRTNWINRVAKLTNRIHNVDNLGEAITNFRI